MTILEEIYKHKLKCEVAEDKSEFSLEVLKEQCRKTKDWCLAQHASPVLIF